MINNIRQNLLRLAALAALVFVAPAMAEDCKEQKGKCFGVDWNTATPAQVANVDVNAKDDKGRTPLQMAVRLNESPEVAETLIRNGANISVKIKGWTLLHIAAQANKNPDVLDFLIRNGLDVNVKRGRNGWLPIHMAAQWNPNPEISAVLVRNGAFVEARSDRSRQTPLMLAKKHNKNPEVAKYLRTVAD